MDANRSRILELERHVALLKRIVMALLFEKRGVTLPPNAVDVIWKNNAGRFTVVENDDGSLHVDVDLPLAPSKLIPVEYSKTEEHSVTGELCPRCGVPVKRERIPCPDGKSGCCVCHWGWTCPSCGTTYRET